MAKEYFMIGPKKVMKVLETRTGGLKDNEVERRLEKHGYNELKEEKRITPLQIFVNQFKNFLVMLLVAAVIISLAVGEVNDAVIILIILITNTVLGFVQEYRAEKAMQSLKEMAAPLARVVRNDREQRILARLIVPGDIIILEAGDMVPADARLIESTYLKADEAVITGESVPVTKNISTLHKIKPLGDETNMVFSHTMITEGRAKAVVTKTGMETEIGKIAKLVQTVEERETPLQRKLSKFGKKVGVTVIIICMLLIPLELWRGESLTQSLIIAISLAVSAVPEGLPAIVTISLALGMKKMAEKKALVRKLNAVEGLGSVNVICTDKTGTITKNEMTVKRIYTNKQTIEVSGVGYKPEGGFTPIKPDSLLLKICLLCNNASLFEQAEENEWGITGDPTEASLLVLAAKAGLDKKELEKEYKRIWEIPFDSSRKMMTTVHLTPKNKKMAFVKGAPEIILKKSTRIFEKGNARKMTKRDREKILAQTKGMAEDALRVLGLAYKPVPKKQKRYDHPSLGKELVFVGLVGMIDPPRKEVKDAIRKCELAGIRTIMITGDYKLTAEAVAKKVGLAKEGSLVITGEELDKMTDKELNDKIDKISVCARSKPENKVRILNILQSKGYRVAMTGDGVNDAPALKTADIGIAMGIKGTDVSREASDMILKDDNFATIVDAVKKGRGIYSNIKRFIRLLLAANFDEITLIVMATLLNLPLPLLPVQILWINIVTDGLPALALGTGQEDKDLMKKPPRRRTESILHTMALFVIVAFIVDALQDFALFGLLLHWNYPIKKIRTMLFLNTVMFELFLVFNCRSEEKSVFRLNPLGDKKLFFSVVASFLIQVGAIYIPFMQELLQTTPLGAKDFLIPILFAIPGLFILPELLFKKNNLKN